MQLTKIATVHSAIAVVSTRSDLLERVKNPLFFCSLITNETNVCKLTQTYLHSIELEGKRLCTDSFLHYRPLTWSEYAQHSIA